jgi:hypothetical protein
MTNRERIMTILGGGTPDRVPFLPFGELIPRGSFEHAARMRGMGFIVHGCSLWSETPGEVAARMQADAQLTIYRTPKGEVSESRMTHAGPLSNDSSVRTAWMIKSPADYEAVISLIDGTSYQADAESFLKADRELGDDGILHTWTDEPPYMDAQYFLGLERWSYEQVDHPAEFRALLAALGRRQERRLALLLECPDYFVNLGNLAGNFGPSEYAAQILPYYRRWVPPFKEKGKKVTLHADASNLREYRDLVPATGVDVIEAFTPPPVGNLSLAEARSAWGEDVTIWINFPETVFYSGRAATMEYTVELLRSDPCPNKLIGLTEMGLLGVNASNEGIFKDGILAILDGIDAAGWYR